MRVLLVTLRIERNEWSSTAQLSRSLANALVDDGHTVAVVTGSAAFEKKDQDGYELFCVPIFRNNYDARWLGQWRPSEKMRQYAADIISDVLPDVMIMGAWNYFSEFVYSAKEQRVPIIQIVHDYSLLCLRSWLIKSDRSLCSGPETKGKCLACVKSGLGWKDRWKSRILAFPVIGDILYYMVRNNTRYNYNERKIVEEAYEHMKVYREMIDVYATQTDDSFRIITENGINADKCRLFPQLLMKEKTILYPRQTGRIGVDRALCIIYIGRLTVEKGIDVLLQAFENSVTHCKVELWLVTNDKRSSKCISYDDENMLMNRSVKVYSDLEGEALSRRLALADVCVVPSVGYETGGMTVLEAQAQRVPVVVSTSVGNKVFIKDNFNGMTYNADKVEDLRSIIERISRSPEILERWSENSAIPLSMYSWKKNIDCLLKAAIKSVTI